MSSFEPEKWYVVFRGRKTGIFDNWPDAKEQVYKQKHNSQKGCRKSAAAQRAWLDFHAKHPRQTSNSGSYSGQGSSSDRFVHGSSSPLHSGLKEKRGRTRIYLCQMIIPTKVQNGVLARTACTNLGLPPPFFLTPVAEEIDGEIFWRVQGSMQMVSDGNTKVCTSRYARCVEATREDVAVQLLCELEKFTKMKIVDFNYHNLCGEEAPILGGDNVEFDSEVEVLEQQFRKTNFGV